MSARVYVGRLSFRAQERDVERFFRGYGHISEVLMKNGYAFVEFTDYRDADDAVRDLNGRSLFGDRVIVELAKSRPRGRDMLKYRSRSRSRSRSRDRKRSRSRDRKKRSRSRDRKRRRRSSSTSESPDRNRRSSSSGSVSPKRVTKKTSEKKRKRERSYSSESSRTPSPSPEKKKEKKDKEKSKEKAKEREKGDYEKEKDRGKEREKEKEKAREKEKEKGKEKAKEKDKEKKKEVSSPKKGKEESSAKGMKKEKKAEVVRGRIVIVKGLKGKSKAEKLVKKALKKYGEIENVRLLENGNCLVEFASGESAQRVIEKMSSGHEIDGQPVQVCPLILIVAFISTYTYKQTHTAICCQLLSEVK
uniref:Serine/arginine-rich splicing factor 4 n=1 Tax=Ascaris suum TaxID=6253 RepID=F1KYU8_ASCSU